MSHHGGRHDAPGAADFDKDRHRLTLYHQAMCGRVCELLPYEDDADVWQHPDTATTIRLPSHPPTENLTVSADDWYRIAVTHRALHHACGTFALDLDRPEPFFRRQRPAPLGDGLPALEQLVRHFGRTGLAVEILATLEDLRVDSVALRRLPGLAPVYRQVMKGALHGRPEPAQLAPRAAMAEALVRISLGADSLRLDRALAPALATVVAVARLMTNPAATVETAAEGTIRVYGVLASLPNVSRNPDLVTLRVADLGADVDAFAHIGTGEEMRLEGDDVLDVRFLPVRYRDVPGPRYFGQAASGMPLQEAILRMTPTGNWPEESPHADEDGFTAKSLQAERGGVDVTAVERPTGPPTPLPHDHGPDLDGHHHPAEGALHPAAVGDHLYPEWDHVAGRYLRDWCLVQVREPRPAPATDVYRRVLFKYGRLLPGMVRHLERMEPEGRDLALRQPYGDDLDLDACIDAWVDMRTGVEPRDNVFSAFAERSRDVAVAIALDLSSSTAERVEGAGSGGAPTRILDLQREAAVLLGEALERVGDSYGIYGFSGTGRADCRLTVVKDIDAPRSPIMLHRLQALRPDHTTRMAPAIRHLTRRLERHPAASRLLLIISDGRPFDFDYGQQYGEDAVLDYALADTSRALDEARRKGMRPYLITVDPNGEDYLSEICDSREYHVIEDARDLPKAIGELYVVARRTASRPASQIRERTSVSRRVRVGEPSRGL